MVNKDLAKYITVISNGSIIPIEDVIGDKDDKLIYRLILEFKDGTKRSPSIKFIKRLISKMRILNPVIYSKTQYNRYEVKQRSSNELVILEYFQGGLKEKKNGSK